MAALLARIGGLILVLDVIYLAVWEMFLGGVHQELFRRALYAGAACIGAGAIVWIAGRVTARIVGRSCPQCGRRVARGRIYCDEHRSETINRYRDRERERGR